MAPAAARSARPLPGENGADDLGNRLARGRSEAMFLPPNRRRLSRGLPRDASGAALKHVPRNEPAARADA